MTELQRRLQLRVAAAALRDLDRLWSLVDVADLRGTLLPFLDAAPGIVQARYREAAQRATAYYRALRLAETGEDATPELSEPEVPDAEAVRRALSGAGASGIVNARRQGFPARSALAVGRRKVRGAATSLVMAGGRDATLRLAGADARAASWHRITSGNPCDFCADMAQQTLRADPGAHFARHDTCTCTVEIQF